MKSKTDIDFTNQGVFTLENNKIIRKLFLGFIHIHILHHAKEHPIYGSWMLDELREHGYTISAGTLYPILHGMEADGLLLKEEQLVDGKIRKYYRITEKGAAILIEARAKAYELFKEIKE
ncbi:MULTISPECIES: PadR family transcriptional regulator [Cytobacillus]|uniref:Helix-turn-helix transcriptional regulator n=1 Tax=Cytobacillus stercorigallinarum TaxID=2762240 RepID=A0ABR8QP24_9BACI|nr:PadR family transcriptional regulator [Cytobacillus stercorigallinarum]MBD7937284.1 helix-turn-helix transcriptional regulator [Cytobacillus stercorigallinarum]